MVLAQNPLYILTQNKKRALIPKIILLFLLGGIFHLGIYLNVALLNLKTSIKQLILLGSPIFLLIVIGIGIYLAWKKANLKILFYRGQINFGNKVIYYQNINQILLKQDFLDKLFKTYSLNLGKNIFIRHIPNEIQLQNYIQQLINYSKKYNLNNSF